MGIDVRSGLEWCTSPCAAGYVFGLDEGYVFGFGEGYVFGFGEGYVFGFGEGYVFGLDKRRLGNKTRRCG